MIPETQSQEKKDMLRLLGAELRRGAGRALPEPQQLREVFRPPRRRRSPRREPNGAIWANQFDNVANRQAHIETTGPEIWEQTDGKVDGFICAVGTGGTLAGVRMGLEGQRTRTSRSASPIPLGAALYNYYTHGELKSEGTSITEGIGQGRITANLEGAQVDHAFQIPDAEAVADRLRPARGGRPLPRRLDRHQRRRRHRACAASSDPATPS